MTNDPGNRQPPAGRVRTAAALLLPALAGILTLLLLAPFGQARARNLAIRVVTHTALPLAGLSVYCEDSEHHLAKRPAILVINHQSALDPLLVAAAAERDLVPVAKASLRRQFPIGWLMRLAGAVFVDREAGRGSAGLAAAHRALENGMAIVIAPEGTRRHRVTPGSFRPGVVALARHCDVPVVLLYIHAAAQHLGKDPWRLSGGTVHMTVLGMQTAQQVSLASLEQAYLEAEQTWNPVQ